MLLSRDADRKIHEGEIHCPEKVAASISNEDGSQ
jgi:hypothetical protein